MSKATAKEVEEVQLSFQLPPPIYADHITTIPHVVNKTVKLVKALTLEGDILVVEGIEGQIYNVPSAHVRYWK